MTRSLKEVREGEIRSNCSRESHSRIVGWLVKQCTLHHVGGVGWGEYSYLIETSADQAGLACEGGNLHWQITQIN